MTRSVVLIVDDVDATRTGLSELLQLLGYETEEARDGAEGLRLLRGNDRIAVVVLDLFMPGADGYWFREQQLKDPAIADVPIPQDDYDSLATNSTYSDPPNQVSRVGTDLESRRLARSRHDSPIRTRVFGRHGRS